MPTTRTPTGSEFPHTFVPHGVPTREHYGAFMDSWRSRDIVEAQYHLVRFREAVESRHAHSQDLVAASRRAEALLERRIEEGPELDDEIAAAVVALKRAIEDHL